jgi:threonine dehydrogenase-like Zn-dependent dehydrogenase
MPQLQAKTTRGGYMAADNCQIKPGDTVAVMGPGPVGQFAIALCIRRSADAGGVGRLRKRGRNP